MKMLKWKPFVGIVVVVAMVSALMLPVSATSLEENDFIVSAEELKGAEIKIEDENIITITTRTLSSLNRGYARSLTGLYNLFLRISLSF